MACRAAASMRPRRMAAEIVAGGHARTAAAAASMRPRRMAAEISRTSAAPATSRGFNEAAANGRGNHPWRNRC